MNFFEHGVVLHLWEPSIIMFLLLFVLPCLLHPVVGLETFEERFFLLFLNFNHHVLGLCNHLGDLFFHEFYVALEIAFDCLVIFR